MRESFHSGQYFSPDYGGPTGRDRQETLKPEQRNSRLRDLYQKFISKLATPPDQQIIKSASERARKIAEKVPQHPNMESQFTFQQLYFLYEINLASVGEILQVIEAGISMSEITEIYKQKIQNDLDELLMSTQDDLKVIPFKIDHPRFDWGVGKPGETGIFAKDTACQLEVAAYRHELRSYEGFKQISLRYAQSKQSTDKSLFLGKWKGAIKERYGCVKELESPEFDFSIFYE